MFTTTCDFADILLHSVYLMSIIILNVCVDLLLFVEFGVKIAEVVNSGGLVSLELLAPLVEHEIKNSKSPKGWLLDG